MYIFIYKMYKICPSCGTKNPVNETLCINCMSDISAVNVIDKNYSSILDQEQQSNNINKQVQNQKQELNKLALILTENKELKIEVINNAIIGRYHLGKEIFEKLSNPKLISREHVNIFYKDNKWYIRDLNSTNGTYLLLNNSQENSIGLSNLKLEPYKEYELKKNYIINLAKVIDFLIDF